MVPSCSPSLAELENSHSEGITASTGHSEDFSRSDLEINSIFLPHPANPSSMVLVSAKPSLSDFTSPTQPSRPQIYSEQLLLWMMTPDTPAATPLSDRMDAQDPHPKL